MEQMTILQALIFGIVEGASEFLPISSTAHLILTARLLGLEQTSFLKSFEIVIQVGAILSVVVLYWRSFLIDIAVIKRLVCAFIPTGIMGFFLYKVVKQYFFEDLHLVLGALFLGGIILVLFERFRSGEKKEFSCVDKVTYKQAFLIGLCQALAVIPGVSRSATTIVGGVLLGLDRRTAVEFSFLLAVPTLAAATGLDIVKNAGVFSRDQFWLLAVGFFASFVVALIFIKGLLIFIKNYSFVSFGIYRIFLSLLFWLFLIHS